MDLTHVGIGLAVIGVGVSLAVVLPMKPRMKKIVGGIGVVMTIFGLGIIGYGFMSSAGSQDARAQTTTTQTNTNGPQSSQTMMDSPGGVQIQGDNNTVNQGPQDRRITKEDEFVRALSVVGPVTIGLEAYDEREAKFLYGQLYNLLIASKWTADERATVTGQSWVGVYVVIQKDKAVPPGAEEMVKQLRANGIDSWLVRESNSASFEKVDFIVRVGFRPPSNNQ